MSRPWKQLRNLTVSETNKSPVNTLNARATRSIIVNLNSSWPTVVSQQSEPPKKQIRDVVKERRIRNKSIPRPLFQTSWLHDDLCSVAWVLGINLLLVSTKPWIRFDELLLCFVCISMNIFSFGHSSRENSLKWKRFWHSTVWCPSHKYKCNKDLHCGWYLKILSKLHEA